MRNTTKLKLVLQLYTVSLDMDEDGNLQMTLTKKRNGEEQTFLHKNYSAIVGQAFVFMNKQIKKDIIN